MPEELLCHPALPVVDLYPGQVIGDSWIITGPALIRKLARRQARQRQGGPG